MDVEGKRQVLLSLSGALTALSDRMRKQGDAAKRITLLAVRAEQIAQRSWNLNDSKSKNFRRDSEVLSEEVKTFVKEVVEMVLRVKKDAMLGREVASAIAGHAEGIAMLARDIDVLPDAAAVRARLRPLSLTLSTLPERLKANAATIKDVDHISTRAAELAEHSEKLVTSSVGGNQMAVALCRDLRLFAEEAAAVSMEMSRGSALAVGVINDLAEKTVSLSNGKPVTNVPATAHERMMAIAKDIPPAGLVATGVPAVTLPPGGLPPAGMPSAGIPATGKVWM